MPQRNPKTFHPSKRLLLLLALFLGTGAVLFFLKSQGNYILTHRKASPESCLPACNPELAGQTKPGDPPASASENQPLKELLEADFATDKISLFIEKSKYTLTVLYDSQPIKTYSVVFGSSPMGDKRAEGDRKTPEGIYRIRDLYPHAKWSKFIWLDYPTQQDWQEHEQAKSQGEIAADATIGSEIGIHGTPEGSDKLIDTRTNWTWGCISLKNRDVDEIYSVLQPGTVVEIVP